MQNKLQELTDRLYQEGLSKGEVEAKAIIEKAKQEAAEIIVAAEKKSKEILENASNEAAAEKSKIENELKLLSKKSIATIRQQIEQSITAKAIEEPLRSALEEKEFISKIIEESLSAFNPQGSEPISLELLLPKARQSELEEYLQSKIREIFNQGVDIVFDTKTESGFKIKNNRGGYLLSFTEEDFKNLLLQYLKPKSAKFLFEE